MAQFKNNRLNLTCLPWFAMVGWCGFYCVTLSNTALEAIPVFAVPRLAVVHWFCSIPVAYFLASKARHQWPMIRFVFLPAAAMTILYPSFLGPVSWMLMQMEAGFPIRAIVRCALALTISFALIVSSPFSLAWKSNKDWSWTILIWLVLPSIYGLKQFEIFREDFRSNLDGMKILLALRSLERTIEIGGSSSHQGVGETEWRRHLKREVSKIEQSLAREIIDKSLDNQLQRAMQYMSLSRYDDAQKLLLETKPDSPQILLLRALAAKEQSDHRQAEVLSRKLLKTQSIEDTDLRQMSFQLLGEALVRQRKISEAITVYEQAIQQCPNARGEFEMRLGTLHSEAGDTVGAMQHFEQAARFEPKLLQESKNRIGGLKSNSCRF